MHRSTARYSGEPRLEPILNQKALVVGAGGGARAAVYALVRAGAADVVIANRTVARAKQIVRRFSADRGRMRVVGLSALRTAFLRRPRNAPRGGIALLRNRYRRDADERCDDGPVARQERELAARPSSHLASDVASTFATSP